MQGEPSLQRMALAPVQRALGAGRQMSLGRLARVAVLVGAPVLLVGVLAWPMLFTNAEFNEDWPHHLWFMWNQSLAIRSNHYPSLFINYSHSVFYPEYAFYGATLYAIVGTFSLVLGNAPLETYVLAYLLGFAASYGGWYWLARMAGLGRWWANVPAVIFITSGYYLTLIYARGDLPEFTGVSMIPLMIASGLSVLRADRLRLWPALALACSSILFFGSHNLTVVWGSTSMALVGAAGAICIPEVRRWLTWRGVFRVAVLVVPALLVSAWFLLPTAVYQSHTQIGSNYAAWKLYLKSTVHLVSVGHIFTLSRPSATVPSSEFVLSLPVLAMAWAVSSIFIIWRGGFRGPWIRALLICVALAFVVTIMMTHPGLIVALPGPYAFLQFTYRLESYVVLAVTGAVLVGLAAVRQRTQRVRIWAWMLVPILILAVVGAVQQTNSYPRYGGNRNLTFESPTKYPPAGGSMTDYTDAHLPALEDRRGRPAEVTFPATAVHDDRISEVVHLHPRQLVYSNIGSGPELVHVAGAKIVGVDPEGNDVLEIGPSVGASKPTSSHRDSSTETITLSAASSLPVVLGRILSLVGVLLLVGVFAALAVRRRSAAADAGLDAGAGRGR